MQLNRACRCEKKLHANSIRFYRTRGARKGASEISRRVLRVYFLREKLWPSLSLSLLSPWMQVQAGDYRYRLSPPLISRTTVLRNTGNWHPRETRKEWEKKGLGSGRRRHFMTTIFTIFLLHVDPGIERSTKGSRWTSRKCRRCLSSDKPW